MHIRGDKPAHLDAGIHYCPVVEVGAATHPGGDRRFPSPKRLFQTPLNYPPRTLPVSAVPEEIERWLQPMLTNKLMLQEGQRFLSLAIPAADGQG